MLNIKVSSNVYQQQNLVLPDGSILSLLIYFRPMQLGWFINELVWQDFTLNGLRITNNPNMLNQWRNLLPFGLACFSQSSREPSLQDDFSIGYSTLSILTQKEVAGYTEFLKTGSFPAGL